MESKTLPKIFMDESDRNENDFIEKVSAEAIKHRLSYVQLHRALIKTDDWYFKKRLNARPPSSADGILVNKSKG